MVASQSVIQKDYLYKGYTIQPYSPAAGTGLSTHELNQPGCYRDVKDTTCIAQFCMCDPKPSMTGWGTPYFLAWTTTPWTLPSNTALCVGPSIKYNVVRTYNPYSGNPITVVVADALMGSIFNAKAADIALDAYVKGDKTDTVSDCGFDGGQRPRRYDISAAYALGEPGRRRFPCNPRRLRLD